ncbi:4Fe-4S dicluster domain-containing protein [Chloroflexota bacterium]
MLKVNLIEVLPDKCTGCMLCEMACSFHHEQAFSTRKSRIKILQGKEWSFDFPVLCIQCAQAYCIESCPTGAIYREEATGIVLVDAGSCNGCGECLTVCPLRAMTLDEEKGISRKCDLCGGDPECVKWCPSGALILNEVDLDSPAKVSFMDRASRLLQEM